MQALADDVAIIYHTIHIHFAGSVSAVVQLLSLCARSRHFVDARAVPAGYTESRTVANTRRVKRAYHVARKRV